MILVILSIVSQIMDLSDLSLAPYPLLYHKHRDLHGKNMDPHVALCTLGTKAFVPAYH